MARVKTKISEIRVVFTNEAMTAADVYTKIVGGTWRKLASDEGRPLGPVFKAKQTPVVVTEWEEAEPPQE